MIGFLRGKVLEIADNSVILDVRDVGYSVFVPERILLKINAGNDLELFIYHAIREDANLLYGFVTQEELGFFKDLLSVSGVGPKTALSLLHKYEPDPIIVAICGGDEAFFEDISGIGKKTASRIILELKEKMKDKAVNEGGASARGRNEDNRDLIQVLVSLGYRENYIKPKLCQLKCVGSLEERVKEALRILNN